MGLGTHRSPSPCSRRRYVPMILLSGGGRFWSPSPRLGATAGPLARCRDVTQGRFPEGEKGHRPPESPQKMIQQS